MKPIEKKKLHKTVHRAPVNVEAAMHCGMTTYGVLQMVCDTVNEDAKNTNCAIDYIEETVNTVAENEQERYENEQAREEAEAQRKQKFEQNEAQRKETFEQNENERVGNEEQRQATFEDLKEKINKAYQDSEQVRLEADVILNGDGKDKRYDLMMTNYAVKGLVEGKINEYEVTFAEKDAEFLSRYVSLEEGESIDVTAVGGSRILIEMYRILDSEESSGKVIETGTHIVKCTKSENGHLEYNTVIPGNYLFAFSDGENYIVKPNEGDIDILVKHTKAAEVIVRKNGIKGLVAAMQDAQKQLDTTSDKVDNLDGIEIEEITPSTQFVLKEYALKNGDGLQFGQSVKVYKDSSIKDVTYNNQVLTITYIMKDGSENPVSIQMSELIAETELADGLEIKDHKIYVKLANNRETRNYLHFVQEGGKMAISLDGIEEFMKEIEDERQATFERNEGVPTSTDMQTRWGLFNANEATRQQATENILREDDRLTKVEGDVSELASSIGIVTEIEFNKTNTYVDIRYGTFTSNSSYDVVWMYPIKGGIEYECNAVMDQLAGIAFYETNESSSFISGTKDNKFVAPANACYVSITNKKTTNPIAKLTLKTNGEIQPVLAEHATRIDENEKNIKDLQSSISTLKIPFTYNNRWVSYIDGKGQQSGRYSLVEFIELTAGETYICNAKSSQSVGIAFYRDNNYLDTSFVSGTQNNEFTVPADARYVSITNDNELNPLSELTIVKKGSITERVEGIERAVDNVENDVETLKESMQSTSTHELAAKNWWMNYSNGNRYYKAGYDMTGFIPVKPNTTYRCDAKFSASAGVAFFNKEEFANNNPSVYEGGSLSTTFTTTSNTKYIVISNDKSNDVSSINLVNLDTIPSKLDSLNEELGVYHQRFMFENAFGAFRKFGVIGDSLSVGHNYDPITNTTNYRDIPNSWGQILARKLGNVCLNFGKSGATTKSWYDDADNVCYKKLIEAENLCQCYIVGIGTNDNGSNIGSISDIDWSNRDNNADTFYGNYAKILQAINAVAPRAIIFCFTIPYPRVDANKNDAIRAIVNSGNVNNVYIVDLANDYNILFGNRELFRLYTEYHYNALGYAVCAEINLKALNDTLIKHSADNVIKGIGNIPFGSNNVIN